MRDQPGFTASTDPQTPEPELVAQGKEIFQYDTFGDETRLTDELRMHEVIEENVDPVTALSAGLKLDSEALPAEVVEAIAAGEVDLTDPQIYAHAAQARSCCGGSLARWAPLPTAP